MTADHAPFDELAVGWALHALEPEDESFFVAHLAGCDRCATTVAETTDVMAAMATDLPQAEPSAGLRDRLRAAVEQTEQLPAPPAESTPAAPRPAVPAPAHRAVRPIAPDPEPPRTARPRSGWRRRVPLGLVAAGVAAIVGLGIWNVVLTSDRNELQATVAEQGRMVNGLLIPGRATIAPLSEPDGRAVATVVARGDEVDVVTHGLSVNDADSTTYVLWGMGGETAQPLGTFDVDGSQMEMKTVSSGLTGLDQFAAYGISLEPGQEAPSLPTEVVATGQVTS
jgi:anti-sigma factor RsiW